MRRLLLPFAAVCLLTCTDSVTGPHGAPNTDVGLLVWTEVAPATLHATDTTTKVVLRLNVGNPGGSPIRVISGGPPYVSTSNPLKTRGLWGSIRIAHDADTLNAGPNVDFFGDSVYVIPGHTTTYQNYTVTLKSWIAGGWAAAPGTYRIRGWFNGREGRSSQFTIAP